MKQRKDIEQRVHSMLTRKFGGRVHRYFPAETVIFEAQQDGTILVTEMEADCGDRLPLWEQTRPFTQHDVHDAAVAMHRELTFWRPFLKKLTTNSTSFQRAIAW
jgi:hypothetical protein